MHYTQGNFDTHYNNKFEFWMWMLCWKHCHCKKLGIGKKKLYQKKMRSGFTHFWCLTIDFFRDVRKHWGLRKRSRLLSTWKWVESSWISIIPAFPQNHVAVFMSSSHCMTCSVNWSQTNWKNLESAPEVKRVVRTPLYKSCVFWGKQEKTKDGRQWGRIFNQQN